MLEGGTINGLSEKTHPVKVKIEGHFLRAGGIIETNTPQSFPTVDLAGSLVALPEAFPGAASPLPDVCALHLASQDVSSFLVTGRGGIAPEPDAWEPDLLDGGVVWELRLTPNRDRQ